MKVKIKATIGKDGTVQVKTIENAGSSCRAVADQLASVLGAADETTRADTADLYVQPDVGTDLTATN